MKFFDYIRWSLKNLGRQKTRTSLTIVAITVGSLSLILMASLIISIRLSLVDQFNNLGAFNLVTMTKDPNSTDNNNLMGTNGDPSEGKKITDETLASAKKLNYVVDATPILSGIGLGTMKLMGSEKKTWANLTAYDPLTNVFEVPIKAGRKLQKGDMDKIVVGQRFLEDFKYGGKEDELLGKKVILNSKMGGPGSGIDWGDLPQKPPLNADESWWKSQENKGIDIEAEIIGVADNGTVGDGASYITLDWARRLNTTVSWRNDDEVMKKAQEECNRQNIVDKESGKATWSGNDNCRMDGSKYLTLQKEDQTKNNGYTSIVIKIKDTKNLKNVADEVQKLGYGAVTAEAMLEQINKILMLIGTVLALIGGISLFVASIGIINTMIMATFERIKEIGVMRACGATRATIRRLFTFEAAMLGFSGGLFGLIISYFLGLLAKLLVNKFGANLGNIPVDRIGSLPWWLVVAVIAFTTIVGMISGLYPAIKAAKLNPVEALRSE